MKKYYILEERSPSTNYPNALFGDYFEVDDDVDPGVVARYYYAMENGDETYIETD